MQNFKVKITTSANETFGAWREGQHDDMVLSVAMAAWLGENYLLVEETYAEAVPRVVMPRGWGW